VTAAKRAVERARDARPKSSSALTASLTSSKGALAEIPSGTRVVTAPAAPLASASATKADPSKFGPLKIGRAHV